MKNNSLLKKSFITFLALSLYSILIYPQWVNKGLTDNSLFRIVTLGSKIFVASPSFSGSTGGIFYSDNNGETWSLKTNGLTYPWAEAIEVSGNNLYASCFDGLYVSSNYGDTWTKIAFDGQWVRFLKILDSKIFVICNDSLYVSDNGGTNWTNIQYNLQGSPTDIAKIGNTLFVSFAQNYVGGVTGVFKLVENSTSWTPINNGLLSEFFGTPEPITCIISVGSTLYAASYTAIIFRSTNNGDSWEKVYQYMYGFTSLKAYNNNVFAGAGYGRIYLSKDNGNTWVEESAGIPDSLYDFAIEDFAFNNDYAFAISIGKGVWRRALGQLVSATDEISRDKFSLQCFPNPAENTTYISFQINTPTFVTITISDITGKEITTLLSEKLNNGDYNIKWDISDLPSGIYLCHFKTEKNVNTLKIVKK